MSKPVIYTDVDGVLIQSVRRLCDILNTRYDKSVDWRDVKRWDLVDCYPTSTQEIEEIFNGGNFWCYIEDYIMPESQEVLKILSETYDIVAVSIGTFQNICFKTEFLKQHFPMIKEFVALGKEGSLKMDKSIVNMTGNGAYFIDDVLSNIESSNCENKILFSEENVKSEWNGYSDKTVGCWTEVLDIIQLKRKEKIWTK